MSKITLALPPAFKPFKEARNIMNRAELREKVEALILNHPDFTGNFSPEDIPATLAQAVQDEVIHEENFITFFEQNMSMFFYDDAIAKHMITNYLVIIKGILTNETKTFIDGTGYGFFITVMHLPFLKNYLEWGTSIRYPWFCCGTGEEGPNKPFTLWNGFTEQDITVTNREDLENLWWVLIDIWSEFVYLVEVIDE